MKISASATNFLILSSWSAVVRSSAASSFEGKLPYQLYSNGDGGCVESNFVGTGSILSLTPMDQSNTFCETDVLDPFPPEFPDPMTIYTKIELGCDPDSDDAEAVQTKFWDCSTSDCSECTPSPVVTGTTNVGNITATRDNLSECFYGWPSPPLDGGLIPVIGYQTFDEAMGATAIQDDQFFNVLIENSCLSGNTGMDVEEADATGMADDTTSGASGELNGSIHGHSLLLWLAAGSTLLLFGWYL